jgi:hypothetical protein
MRDYSQLFRTFSHSLDLPELGVQRVFKSMPNFSQVKVKPISEWQTPRILSGVEGAVSFPCLVIRVAETITTTCSITKEKLVIGGYKDILCSEVRAILKRLRAKKETALEFFLRSGKSYLIDFTPSDASDIIKSMRACKFDKIEWFQKTSFKEFFKKLGDTNAWVERRISTFDYLMRINVFAGRSFRDASAYPLFPWVITDFATPDLDLDNEGHFRKFWQPIGSSGVISNPAVVAHWLARLEPFASLSVSSLEPFNAIELTGANWELVPEFFCQPEVLIGIPSKQLDDVKLPPWATNALEFVYLHRQALESEFVSDHLHEWLDLMFGIASEGQLPVSLFDAPHPQRGKAISPPSLGASFAFNFERPPLIASIVLSADSRDCRYLNLHADGSITQELVTYGGGCKTVSTGDSVPLQGAKIIVFRSAVLVSAADSLLLRSTGILKLSLPSLQFVSLAGDIFVCLSDEGSVWTFATDGHPTERRQVCSILYERPIALAANPDFDLLVVATLERNLLFYSLSSGVFRLRVDLSGELAEQVLITEGWGFVVALTDASVHVFNVNGLRIRRVSNSKHMTVIAAWKSPRGFDYLFGSDVRGRLMISEAFYADFAAPVCHLRGAVKWLNFVPALNCVSAVMADGRGFLVPCSLQ